MKEQEAKENFEIARDDWLSEREEGEFETAGEPFVDDWGRMSQYVWGDDGREYMLTLYSDGNIYIS